jgi:spore coat protein U-like protein
VSFSILNGYKLKHTTAKVILSKFFLNYEGTKISDNTNDVQEVTVPCSHEPSELKFTPSGTLLDKDSIVDGAYKDTVTIVVTSP